MKLQEERRDGHFRFDKGRGHLYKRSVNGLEVYYMDVKFTDGARKRISTGETNQKVAWASGERKLNELLNGEAKKDQVSFGDFVERYLDMPTKKMTSPKDGRLNRQWYFKTLSNHFGAVCTKENGALHFSGAICCFLP